MLTFVRLCERLTGSFGMVAAWVVVPLVLATVFEVFSRYVLNDPTIWAYEIGYMATGTNFMLGMAFTLRERGHIRIDVLYTRFDERTKALVDLLSYVVLLLPLAFWLSLDLWSYAFDAYVIGEVTGESAWNPLVWPFRMTFFAGFCLLVVQGLVETIKVTYFLLGWELEAAGSSPSDG
ncbi:MAG TPA: TRAP transporter small permease subunit [Alphaproteobacteria bacterium]|jgi:TRAP-type mannitol/chloroaromatic compound transport system permease small subunit|nr:TRAP transporter small permease subunit [Alphaproteobacteria bacterium]MDP7163864.1 TRAP transporter small permease subunit [Alphaproteobacteria bacterium]HJM50061.1 TRAP transporter small permease subunit [Alphaproteobacteria bacterium]